MYDLLRFANSAELAAAAAARFGELVADHAGLAPVMIALSGGRITSPFFDSLVAARPRLAAVHFFFADERGVPPDHPESNFRLADMRLFQPLRVPEQQVHRLRGELDPADAASLAEAEFRQVAASTTRGTAADVPAFDLVLLGMGEDGHVASLFPGAPEAVVESRAVYVPVVGPKPPPQRLTLTFAALAAARAVWVLVSGEGKAAALRESLRADGATPLARVIRSRRHTLIFSDLAGGR